MYLTTFSLVYYVKLLKLEYTGAQIQQLWKMRREELHGYSESHLIAVRKTTKDKVALISQRERCYIWAPFCSEESLQNQTLSIRVPKILFGGNFEEALKGTVKILRESESFAILVYCLSLISHLYYGCSVEIKKTLL